MARYPALEIHGVDDAGLVLAAVDDFSPAAAEDRDGGVRVFFAGAELRDRAAAAVRAAWPSASVTTLEVDDEDWARRSQADLKPVTVGRITVAPARVTAPNPESPLPNPIRITIQPSMGFGTGHHATTRLCLAALQTIDLAGRRVLDVGTGSGILAIAAVRLGARTALGIDHDADAIASATENLDLNPEVRGVRFETTDLRKAAIEPADVVCANLTGALLASVAPLLRRALKPGGTLIVSGLLEDEEETVRQALSADSAVRGAASPPTAVVAWRGAEQGWVALAVNYPDAAAV